MESLRAETDFVNALKALERLQSTSIAPRHGLPRRRERTGNRRLALVAATLTLIKGELSTITGDLTAATSARQR
jgi:hypothetical protein